MLDFTIATVHSMTLETWTAHVGRDSALAGSGNISKAELLSAVKIVAITHMADALSTRARDLCSSAAAGGKTLPLKEGAASGLGVRRCWRDGWRASEELEGTREGTMEEKRGIFTQSLLIREGGIREHLGVATVDSWTRWIRAAQNHHHRDRG